MKDVIVFTEARCNFCKQMKDFLNKNQIDYIEKDVSNRENFEELMRLKGQGVPFTLIRKRPFTGFNERVKTALIDYKTKI